MRGQNVVVMPGIVIAAGAVIGAISVLIRDARTPNRGSGCAGIRSIDEGGSNGER